MLQDTDAPLPYVERYERERLQNRSSPTNNTAEENTYDLVDAGPRNRFTVFTTCGPVIAHNCLGGGYGLGAKGLMGYAEGFGLELTEKEAQDHVNAFRETYHEIPAFWNWIKDSVFRCVQTGCTVASAYFRIEMQGEFLRIRLPSGRYLSYHRPEIIKKEAPWGDVIDNFSFMGINRFTMKWERVTAHPGFLTENVTQAIARDILGAWLLRAQEAGFDLFLHVHDELGALVTESRLQELNDLIRKPISWAPGLVLDADGYTSTRYKKG